MKAIVKVSIIIGLFASLNFALVPRAQAAITTAEYDALIQALEATTPLPATNAPVIGNFYTIQHGEAWPPLPGDTMNLPYWDLGGGVFVLDDTNVDYSVLQAESTSSGRFRLEDSFESDFSSFSYTSNDLWLQILGVTNGTSSLVIHPPSSVTNGVFDLLYATNLAQPISWSWLLRTDPGQTNLAVPNATNAQGFYRLGPPNDLTANDSLGTDFWLAIPEMAISSDTAISLYISSPFGASGTVTIQNPTNGPILIVTNCGDIAANGMYFLTNEALNPVVYNLMGNPVQNAYVKGNFVVFFDDDISANLGWILADTNTQTPLYYGGSLYQINLNDDFWAVLDGTGTPPTTLCQQLTFSQAFGVAVGGLTNVPIPAATMMTDSDNDVIETNFGVHVVSTAPISVYAVDYLPQGTAAFTAYPTPLLGTNYCLMARPGNYGGLESELAVVATQDHTMVTITPSATAGPLYFGHSGPYTNYLDTGQTYQTQTVDKSDDVTGTLISSDKLIAVFAGADIAFVPDANTQVGNPLIQEQIPMNDWGTNALALSLAGRNGGDSYRVLAASNNTTIRVTGNVLTSTNEMTSPYTVTTSNETVTVTITNAGQFYDIGVDGPVQFHATKPIQVAQFANGNAWDNLPGNTGDPCEILLPSTDHYLETNIVFTLGTNAGDFVTNYLSIIVPRSATNSTFVNGSVIPAANFALITNSGYYGAQILVTNVSATYKVTSSQPVGVEVYGWGDQDAYGYFGGIVK